MARHTGPLHLSVDDLPDTSADNPLQENSTINPAQKPDRMPDRNVCISRNQSNDRERVNDTPAALPEKNHIKSARKIPLVQALVVNRLELKSQ